ncbi:uncharacterized protein N7511_003825 [Penicillium nucicola]|uniref:uncharacterized protein n=1 Tax=Penicillium nucicola TaxID=1850975 RepID=UPI0025459575|nr:uncharacterized protein N7511_003825 [Penicillium nucicola]KAJ5766209.1 hypothetical protein N7511_003825 [Penicillium nucicola]
MLFEIVLDTLQSSAFLIIIVVVLGLAIYDAVLHPGFPLIGTDTKDGYSRGLAKARQQWTAHGKELIDQGLTQASARFTGCFQVFTEVGPKLVLPNRFAHEIRNHSSFHFGSAVSAVREEILCYYFNSFRSSEFFGSYPGFEPFALDSSSQVVIDTVKGRLTQSLNWTEITYKPKLLHLISRISSRVFLGPGLCENGEWRNISTEYAVAAFVAARALRQWNFALRPIIHWFLPECRQLRATLAQARRILKPVIEKRRDENRQRHDHGQGQFKVADTIGWMDEAARGQPYDAAVAQIGLSLAAIHTTTEMVSGLISDLCANPEYFEPLREEIALAIADKGWSKKALQDLKLMDSAMKESQRHHFGDVAAMNRMTVSPVTLSDGTQIPKGALTMIGINQMHDASVFPEPHKYKGDRFFKMRQEPGQEQRWQFVSTAPEHLVFGHGKHACPGRFFAANEIKVVLIFLLMNYDWKFTAEGRKVDKSFGQETDTDPTARAMIRRRKKQGVVL